MTKRIWKFGGGWCAVSPKGGRAKYFKNHKAAQKYAGTGKKRTTTKSTTSKSRKSSTRRSNPAGGVKTGIRAKFGVWFRRARTILNAIGPGLNPFQPRYEAYPLEWKAKQVLRNYTGFRWDTGKIQIQEATPAWQGIGITAINDWFDRKTRKSAKISRGKIIHIISEAIPVIIAHDHASGSPDYTYEFATKYNRMTTGYDMVDGDWDAGRLNTYVLGKLVAWGYDAIVPQSIKSGLNRAFPKNINPF